MYVNVVFCATFVTIFFTLNIVHDSNRREVDLSDTVLQNCVPSVPLSCSSKTSG